jgi:hypothetical protein
LKYQVLRRFKDKHSSKIINVEDVFEIEKEEAALKLQEKGIIGKKVGDEESKGEGIPSSPLDRNANDAIKSITADLNQGELKNLLKLETEGKDRKSVKEHIESLLKG